MDPLNNDVIGARIAGCLLGGAVGDALGYPIEFLRGGDIFTPERPAGVGGYLSAGTALFSDDTQMTVFTAAGLLNAAANPDSGKTPQEWVLGAYRDWYGTQFLSGPEQAGAVSAWPANLRFLYANRAPGNTCLSGVRIRRPEDGGDFIARPINRSKGCGGVMRVAPVGCLPGLSLKDAALLGAQCAAITHSAPGGYLPAALLAACVRRLIAAPDEGIAAAAAAALDTVEAAFAGTPGLEGFAALTRRAFALANEATNDLDGILALGEGWVGDEALAIALFAALRHPRDFSAGVIAAVNHGGDSDSTGAICGNLLGAALGRGAIEDRWLTPLEGRELLLTLAADLAACHLPWRADPESDAVLREKYVLATYGRETAS